MDVTKEIKDKQTNLSPGSSASSLNRKSVPQKTASKEEFFKAQVAAIEEIKYLNHSHYRFKEWDRVNRRFLEEYVGRSYLERYRLILFSEPQRNGFVFRKPSVSWGDKECYQRGLQRAKIFFKSMLWELREASVKDKT